MKLKFKKNINESKKKKNKYRNFSLDDVVDKYILEYEDNSREIIKENNFNHRDFLKNYILSEEEKKETNKDYKIDPHEFAKNIYRLIENYENLIDFRDIILRRAANFVYNNYNKETFHEYERFLKENFDVEIGESDLDREFEFQAPFAQRSGPSSS